MHAGGPGGDDPGFDASLAIEIVDGAENARLEVIPTERNFRSELVRLGRLVPPLLGVSGPERLEGRRRGKLF